MKFNIHHSKGFLNEDVITIEGETIEEVREKTFKEMAVRGWEEDNCWSEKIN